MYARERIWPYVIPAYGLPSRTYLIKDWHPGFKTMVLPGFSIRLVRVESPSKATAMTFELRPMVGSKSTRTID
jgi:hypothetical protein